MTVFEFIKGDISEVKADVIVNAANKTLLGGGGVDGAIHRRAGPGLLAECMSLGGCAAGLAKITGGHRLPAKFVIHTVGPVWNGGNKDEAGLLTACYRNSLVIAKERGLRSIAFPAISTGVYRFPRELAMPIAINTTMSFVKSNPSAFDKIIFVLFSDEDLENYKAYFSKIG